MRSLIRLAGLATCVLAAGAARADVPRAAGRWHTVTLPVTAERLCDAAGLPAPATAESVLFNLVRVLHERPLPPGNFERGRARVALELLRPAPEPSAAGDARPLTPVPLPLAPETWANVILKRRLSPQALAGAILADRRASLLYVGLSQMDASTLAAIERLPGVLWSFDEGHASALAAFGGSLTIDDRGVRVPGPPEMASAWAALVGAPASDPARFLPALLERDRGRLAYFFDALTRLDAAHQRFALGTADAAGGPLANLTALYEIFRRVSPEWDAALFPFYRPAIDPAAVLETFRIGDDGRLAPPWPRSLWERAFHGHLGAGGAAASAARNDDADAAWMVDAVLAPGPKGAPVRAAQVRFAQRVFAREGAAPDGSLAAAIAGFARFPALMLTLERLGFTRPAEYVEAARLAAALTRRDGQPLALFQASLALVDRSAWTRSLDAADARRLARSLLALDERADDVDARIAGWLKADLVPSLAGATGAARPGGAETVVLRGLAGIRAPDGAGPPPIVEWLGRRYHVDEAAGTFARFAPIRERQGPPTLDQALAFDAAMGSLASGGDRRASGEALLGLLGDLIAALPAIEPNRELRETLGRARTRLAAAMVAGGAPRITAELTRDLARARQTVLADVLTSLVYVPHLGYPNGPARLGGHVARRHLFAPARDLVGDGAEPAWRIPSEVVTPERGWHVEGALLGLDQALARLALRRLDVDVIPVAPRLDETTRRLFVLDAAQARPFDLSDADRDVIASALAAGRARVARLAERPDALGSVAAALGLEARRVQAIDWVLAGATPDPVPRFSLAELVRLGAGRPLPFVVVTIPADACPRGAPTCGISATDLTLRLVAGLAERQLPAALLPGLLGAATQDFVDQVQPYYPGDLEALWTEVANLPRERFDDYVGALEGSGALRPLVPSEGGEREP